MMGLLALTVILVVVGTSPAGDTVTIPTFDLAEVLASPEWATVQAHRLVGLRAAEREVGAGALRGPGDPGPTTTTLPPSTEPIPSRIGWRPEVERWRGLVATYFPADQVEMALGVLRCESLGDPSAVNPTSHTTGLFQMRLEYWPGRAEAAGWAGHSPTEAEANIAVAAHLVHHDGWRHWSGAAWGIDSCTEWARAQLGV